MGRTAPDKVDELRDAVAKLSREELAKFEAWFDDFREAAWDAQIEDDLKAGRLDHVVNQVKRDVEAGRYTEL
jgi:hypothetical protein